MSLSIFSGISTPLRLRPARRPGVLFGAALSPLFGFASSASAQVGPPPPPSVTVHIQSDRPVALFVQSEEPIASEPAPIGDGRSAADVPRGAQKMWVLACDAPCDRPMPLDREYRLDAHGLRPTRAFRLTGRPDERVVVTFEPSTTASFATGITVAAIGLAGIQSGLAFLLASRSFGGDLPGASQEANTGAALIAVGAVVGVVGVSILAANARSGASVTPSDGTPASPPPSLRQDPSERAPRVSTWRETIPLPARATPITVPLWSMTF